MAAARLQLVIVLVPILGWLSTEPAVMSSSGLVIEGHSVVNITDICLILQGVQKRTHGPKCYFV